MRLIVLGFISIGLVACSAPDSHRDLRDFIADNKRRPPGEVKPAPKIEPYESFEYDAYRLRSPFDRPVSIQVQRTAQVASNVKPDQLRQKERLEQYDLSSLSMVGTLEKSGTLWALISDPEGGVDRVRVGNFMGKNHGKITSLTRGQIDLTEIVASGDGWLERPNVVELKTTEQK